VTVGVAVGGVPVGVGVAPDGMSKFRLHVAVPLSASVIWTLELPIVGVAPEHVVFEAIDQPDGNANEIVNWPEFPVQSMVSVVPSLAVKELSLGDRSHPDGLATVTGSPVPPSGSVSKIRFMVWVPAA